jgi:hypothetical protein
VVARYAAMMASGEWRPGSQIVICQDSENGQAFLINGQHRLSAIVESETQQTFSVLWRDESYDEAKLSYQYEDSHKRRSPLDAIRVSNLTEQTGLFEKDLRVLAAAVILIEGGFTDRQALTPKRKNELVISWAADYSEYCSLVSAEGENTKNYSNAIYSASRRSMVAGCAIYTLRNQTDIAKTFWSNVFSPKQMNYNSPEIRLREFLISHNAVTDGGTGGRRRHLAAISKTWKAAYRGETISKLYLNSDFPSPLFVGCPDVKRNKTIIEISQEIPLVESDTTK